MGEAKVRSIALFFFFAFMDDRKIAEASTKALSIFEKKKKNLKISDDVLLVASTFFVWTKHYVGLERGGLNFSNDNGWVVPNNVDLGAWREFQKLATQEELLVVIWSKILNFSDKDIAQGLGVSVGTIRYRLSKALRKLGGMAQGISTNKLSVVL